MRLMTKGNIFFFCMVSSVDFFLLTTVCFPFFRDLLTIRNYFRYLQTLRLTTNIKKKRIRRVKSKFLYKFHAFRFLRYKSYVGSVTSVRYFFHAAFLNHYAAIKNSGFFLTLNQVSNFSNALVTRSLLTAKQVNSFFDRLPLPALRFQNVRLTRRATSPRLFLEKNEKTDQYHFLEGNTGGENRSKNFFFFNTHYYYFVKPAPVKNKKIKKLKFFHFTLLKFKFAQKFIKKKKQSLFFMTFFKKLAKSFKSFSQLSLNFGRLCFKRSLWLSTKFEHLRLIRMHRPLFREKKKIGVSPIFSSFRHRIQFCVLVNMVRDTVSTLSLFFYKLSLNASVRFVSKWNAFFLTSNTGFLFTSVLDIYLNLSAQGRANFKREFYSFSTRNELEKRFLKKYFFFNNIEYYNEQEDKFDQLIAEPHCLQFDSARMAYAFFIADISAAEMRSNVNVQKHYWTRLSSIDADLNIRRIRFKPGYSIIWREARAVLKVNLNFRLRYQHQLTSRLLKYKKIIKTKLYAIAHLNFLNLIIKSKFFPDFSSSLLFLQSGLVSLNGKSCTNEDAQIFIGDLIQLTVLLKYYITYKNLFAEVLEKKKRLDRFVKGTQTKLFDSSSFQKERNYPRWIMHNKNLLDDIPKFLEVDFYSLSCFFLYEPFLWVDFSPNEFYFLKFSVINLYNWKYIN